MYWVLIRSASPRPVSGEVRKILFLIALIWSYVFGFLICMFWLILYSRFLFWTNWNNEKPRIQRSNLKGLESRDVITKDILTPNGLTLDHVARKLYWSDARLDKIERCDMDGANRIVSFAWQVLRFKVISLLHFF